MRTRDEVHAYFDLLGLPRIPDAERGRYGFADGTAAWLPTEPGADSEHQLYVRANAWFGFREGRLLRPFGLVGRTEEALVGTPNVPVRGWRVRDAGAVPLDMIFELEVPASELLRLSDERGTPY